MIKFIQTVSDMKTRRDKGESDVMTYEKLQGWRYNVERQENQRMQMLEDQLRRIEEKRKEAIEETITTTNFADKLYEISMQMPDVWSNLKN